MRRLADRSRPRRRRSRRPGRGRGHARGSGKKSEISDREISEALLAVINTRKYPLLCQHLPPHIIKKLRTWLNTRHQQIIPCPCTCDIEQVSFSVIYLLQIGIITNRLDAFL
jgi:hypothetical protein